jgi:hypothetical protein
VAKLAAAPRVSMAAARAKTTAATASKKKRRRWETSK